MSGYPTSQAFAGQNQGYTNDPSLGGAGGNGHLGGAHTAGAHGNATHGDKPTFGDKVSGTVDTMVGKVTGNPAKVAEGEMKKTSHSGALSASGTYAPGLGQGTHTGPFADDVTGHRSGLATGHHTAGHTGPTTTGFGNVAGNQHTSHNTNPNKATVGDKISGTMDVAVGKVTGNHAKVMEGEIKKSDHAGAAHGGLNDPYGAGTHGVGTHGAGTHGVGTHGAGTHGVGTHGAGANALGSHTTHNKPTIGDKISGTVETVVGKVTGNPAKVQEGEIKKTLGSDALNNNQYGSNANTTGAYGAGHTGYTH